MVCMGVFNFKKEKERIIVMQIDPNAKMKRKHKKAKLSRKDRKKLKKMASAKFGKKMKHIKNPMEKVINEKNVFSSDKLFVNQRVFIDLEDLKHCSRDYLYSNKSYRKNISVRPISRISLTEQKSQKPEEIRFDNIAYILFEVRKGIEFPNLELEKDLFKKKELTITRVGSEYDHFDKKLIERDLQMVNKNIPWLDTEVDVYRIRKRTFVQITQFLDTLSELILQLEEVDQDIERYENHTDDMQFSSIRYKVKNALGSIDATAKEKRKFFQSVLSAHVVMKNGDVYFAQPVTTGFIN